jgi:hypothetical protein
MIETCPDCGVRSGELHDLFCLKERCRFCGGQLATCSCIRNVLKLSDSERQALDEYIDDSVPPLSDIVQRWREALASKGRVPFEAFPDDPIRAAYRGDVEAMRQFLDDGFPVNAGNEVGYHADHGEERRGYPLHAEHELAALRVRQAHNRTATCGRLGWDGIEARWRGRRDFLKALLRLSASRTTGRCGGCSDDV